MNLEEFRSTVFNFYLNHNRPLPWRETRDPYAITVSEVMLQQTQVERTLPKYQAFLKALPTWESLANVSTEQLFLLWQGLGYNRRALALKRMAEKVVKEYHGQLPSEYETLLSFPGIGPYTAAAISVFAFGKDIPMLETNVRRVYIHHFFADRTDVHDKELLPLIRQSMDHENPRQWFYALMDYGSWLAKQVPNPNRRSKHYTRQSSFQGSKRQLRGKILKLLSEASQLSLSEMYKKISDDPVRIRRAAEELQKEGFIILEGETLHFA